MDAQPGRPTRPSGHREAVTELRITPLTCQRHLGGPTVEVRCRGDLAFQVSKLVVGSRVAVMCEVRFERGRDGDRDRPRCHVAGLGVADLAPAGQLALPGLGTAGLA